MKKKMDKWIQFLIKNQKGFFYSFLTMVLILLAGSKVSSYFSSDKMADFLEAKKKLSKLSMDDSSVAEVMQIWEKYPSLIPNYQGQLIEKMWDQHDPQIQELLPKALKEKENLSSVFAQFSRASYLISQNEYRSAVDISLKIEGFFKNKEESKLQDFQGLVLLNTLRLCVLYRKLNMPQEELLFVEKMEKMINNDQYKHNLHLIHKDISLYLPARKSLLAAQLKQKN